MTTTRAFFVTLTLALLSMPHGAYAATIDAPESISSFIVNVTVHEDSSFFVHERILYDFSSNHKHGIYRDIPRWYGSRFFSRYIPITVRSASRSGKNNELYTLQTRGTDLRIKIGDPNVTITGEHQYDIMYDAEHAVFQEDDADVIRWNMIGTGWTVPIYNAQAHISFDIPVPEGQLRVQCFRGAWGSTQACPTAQVEQDTAGNVTSISYTLEELAGNEGMTVEMRLPKGLLTPPSALQWLLWGLRVYWPLTLPLLTGALLIWRWVAIGRDPKGRATIVTEFAPPDNLGPAEVGTLIDETVHDKDLAAAIVYLAQQGYLRIAKEGVSYRLFLLKETEDAIRPYERLLLAALFKKADAERSVLLSELKNTIYSDIEKVRDSIYTDLTQARYFRSHPEKERRWYRIVAMIVGMLLFFCAIWLSTLVFVSGSICVVLVFLFSSFMVARTHKGVMARQHILGLQQYITVAEKDRIAFHNAPEKTTEHFEALLAYAMALGVEKKWAAKFEGIMQPPRWFTGAGGSMTAHGFVGDLSSFSKAATASALSRPQSSGGGGGHSGGGAGGGGGGSW